MSALKCVVCGEEKSSVIKCVECGGVICFDCSAEQPSSRFICCCCHKHEFKPLDAFSQLSEADFSEWWDCYLLRRMKIALETKSKLRSIVRSFVDEIYLSIPIIDGVVTMRMIITHQSSEDEGAYVSSVDDLNELERMKFERFTNEFKRFIDDNSYVMYSPRAHKSLKIVRDDKTMSEFMKLSSEYLKRWNPTRCCEEELRGWLFSTR